MHISQDRPGERPFHQDDTDAETKPHPYREIPKNNNGGVVSAEFEPELPTIPTFLKSYYGVAATPISRDITVSVLPQDREISGVEAVTIQRNFIYRAISLVIDETSDLRELDLIEHGTRVVVEEHDPRKVDPSNDPYDIQKVVELYKSAGISQALPKVFHIVRPLNMPIVTIPSGSEY